MLGARPGVLIVDAGERSAIAACECLTRAGYRAATASSHEIAPSGWSRYSERRFRLPSPRAAPREFAGRVAAIAARHSYMTALPCSEGALQALSDHREVLRGDGFVLGLPDRDAVRQATSKARLLKLAPGAGLAAPKTIACEGREQARKAADGLGYPVILKPLRTVFQAGGEARHVSSALVGDPEALEAQLAVVDRACLLQRRERGFTVSLGAVIVGGRLLAHACSRYRRTWPPGAGSACFSESIAPSASLLDSATRLATSLGWEGIFELELIERSDGEYAALDFNPRLYGSLALAVGAGAPLPVTWCDWLLRGVETPFRARPGVRYRWLDADMRYLAHSLRGRDFRAAASVLRPRRGVVHPYERLRDPLPALVRGMAILAGLGRGGSFRGRLDSVLRD